MKLPDNVAAAYLKIQIKLKELEISRCDFPGWSIPGLTINIIPVMINFENPCKLNKNILFPFWLYCYPFRGNIRQPSNAKRSVYCMNIQP